MVTNTSDPSPMLKNLPTHAQSDPHDTLPKHEIVLADPENPRAVLNLVPPRIREAAAMAISSHPQLFDLDEKTLRDKVRPSDSVLRIRVAFWNEYFRVQDAELPKMDAAKIYAGVVHQQMFYGHILGKPGNVAWILCPPHNYMIAMEEILDRGMNNLAKIIGMPVTTDGEVDVKKAKLFLEAFKTVQERVKGSVVQRQAIAQYRVPVEQGAGGEDARKELEALREKFVPEAQAEEIVKPKLEPITIYGSNYKPGEDE